jgi:hypothetical protein
MLNYGHDSRTEALLAQKHVYDTKTGYALDLPLYLQVVGATTDMVTHMQEQRALRGMPLLVDFPDVGDQPWG